MPILQNFLTADSKARWLLSRLLLVLPPILRARKLPLAAGAHVRLHNAVLPVTLALDPSSRQEERAFCDRFFRPGDVFVDVGANVGFYSLIAAARGATVHAFEANRRIVSLLCDNVASNATGNIVVHGMALGAENGEATFHMRRYGDAFGSLGAGVRVFSRHERVRVARADSLLPSVPITLVKIDVEGAEDDVLAGFGDRLRDVRAVRFEADEALWRAYGTSFATIRARLATFGFAAYREHGGAVSLLPPDFLPTEREDLYALRPGDLPWFCERLGWHQMNPFPTYSAST